MKIYCHIPLKGNGQQKPNCLKECENGWETAGKKVRRPSFHVPMDEDST